MVDNVGSGSSVYGKALLRVGSSIRERLIQKLETKEAPKTIAMPALPKTPAAVPVKLAELAPELREKEFGGDQIAELLTGEAAPVATDPDVLESVESQPVAPIELKPGAEFSGTFHDGKLSFPGGEGRYFVEPGYQTIKFEFGGYTGHMLSPTKAMAYNAETKQIVTFDVQLGDGQFKISNVAELSKEPSDLPKTPDFAGKFDGKHAVFDNGMQIEFKGDGRIKISLGDPNSADHNYLEGDGFIDESGNLVAMFQNGAAISAKYVRGENSFDIFNYAVLKGS